MVMGGKVVGEHNPNRVDKLLTPEMADKNMRRRVMAFLEAIETAVLEANTAVIGREIPHLNQETFLKMAVRVAELRADYIRLGLKLADVRHPDPSALDELARARHAYEEMMAVFEAAERVIERGYVRLD